MNKSLYPISMMPIIDSYRQFLSQKSLLWFHLKVVYFFKLLTLNDFIIMKTVHKASYF